VAEKADQRGKRERERETEREKEREREKREEGRRKREEGRRKREEGRGKREEGREKALAWFFVALEFCETRDRCSVKKPVFYVVSIHNGILCSHEEE
jgi:hypothetical protein